MNAKLPLTMTLDPKPIGPREKSSKLEGDRNFDI